MSPERYRATCGTKVARQAPLRERHRQPPQGCAARRIRCAPWSERSAQSPAMTRALAPDDIVAHATRRPRRNERPPLLVARAAAGVPRRARARRSGEPRGRADRRRPLERHLRRRPRRRARSSLRRPPRGPLPPSAHDVLREARVLRALAGQAARVPAVLAVVRRRGASSARRSTSWSASTGDVVTSELPPALDTPEDAPADRRGARRRARRDPRRRLAGRGPGGLREADRLPRAPAAALPRAVGAQPHARDPGGRARRRVAGARTCPSPARRRSCTATTASATRCIAPERPPRAGRGLRLGDGDDRRPARRPRLPLHAVDRPRRPAARHVRAVGASRASRASRRATSSSRATRSAPGAR